MKLLKCKSFIKILPATLTAWSVFAITNCANAAPRTAIRGTAGVRPPVTGVSTNTTNQLTTAEEQLLDDSLKDIADSYKDTPSIPKLSVNSTAKIGSSSVTKTPVTSLSVTPTGTVPSQIAVTPETLPVVNVSTIELEQPVIETIAIENKASKFSETISATTTTSDNAANNYLADMLRQQRAAIDARDTTAGLDSAAKSAKKTRHNQCDEGLRKCMIETCGNDYSKCALDGDTILGDKFNRCRRDTKCTGEEFRLFTAEIKADRDMHVRLNSYKSVVDCGVDYNSCVSEVCGPMYDKCLGKNAEDNAKQQCKQIADRCKEQDSGLSSRFSTVMGKMRENAEIDIKKDEERLYALRDLMKTTCEKLGAMFDERTFDCVYTVNFYVGEEAANEPIASRKRYAGTTFTCTPEWFGVDVTTYKENAYRETRSQKGASSAMLGAGVGVAAGLVASGALSRAKETQDAKKGLDEEKCKSGDESACNTSLMDSIKNKLGNNSKNSANNNDTNNKDTNNNANSPNSNKGSSNNTPPNDNTPKKQVEKKPEGRVTKLCVGDCKKAEEVANKMKKKLEAAKLGKKFKPTDNAKDEWDELGS